MRVGYYAHHHGRGHVSRAAAVLRHVRVPAALFTSAPAPDVPPGVRLVPLPPDAPRSAADTAPAPPFHYAPTGHAGLRQRMARIAAWAAEGPGVLVVDVSCEVAVFGRLLSLPVVVARQHGARWDWAHRTAYGLAERLLAPFPASLEEPDAPDWVRAKTVYAGGFSRFDGRAVPPPPVERRVAVVGGGGGGGPGSGRAWRAEDVAAAARTTPDWRWTLLGAEADVSAPENLEAVGWTDDPFPHLTAASVVITTAGHNGTMEAAAVGRPLIVIPEERPFEEQRRKAAALDRVGAALVRGAWPAPEAWPALLEEARRTDPGPLRALVDGGGARRAAALLDALAETASGEAFGTADAA